METKNRIILRHKPSGLYFSKNADHTKHLWQAWRFYDREYVGIWLENAHYAPQNRDEYEQIEVKLTIELEC